MSTTVQERAQQLREELRNGRASTSRPDSGAITPNGGSDDSPLGTTLQDARGSVEFVQTSDTGHENGDQPGGTGVGLDEGTTGDSPRSTQRSIIRPRRERRRPGQSNPGALASATPAESVLTTGPIEVGNLVADGFVPTREEKEKPKRDRRGYINPKRKAQMEEREARKTEEKKPFLPQGKKLSAQEATILAPQFSDTMTDYFQYIDQYLWTREELAGKSSGQRPIWSDLDQEEMEALTRVFMKFGQNNPAAAVVVRGVVESRDYLTAAFLFGPRIEKTRQILVETHVPKQPRGRK